MVRLTPGFSLKESKENLVWNVKKILRTTASIKSADVVRAVRHIENNTHIRKERAA